MNDDHEVGRVFVESWKLAAVELDQVKWEELRAMTAEDSVKMLSLLHWPRDVPIWRSPDREGATGLVEQQRLFRLAHDFAAHS